MKILYLPAYTFPESVASSYLGRNQNESFAKAGFKMIAYAPTPTRGISKEIRKVYKKKSKKKELLFDGAYELHRFSMFNEPRNPLGRAIRYFYCALKHLAYGLCVKNIDVVMLSSTPPIQGAVGAIIHKIRKVPFIYNLQDIFPDSLVGTGMTKKGSILWKIGRVIENFTYRNACKIIVISKDFKRNIMAKGVPEDKIEVIYNWVEEQSVYNIPREENILFDRYNLDRNKFYISYCGNIGLTQNMDMLLKVAKKMKPYGDIHFVLIGEGAYKEQVEKKIKEQNIDNITLLPFQPYEEISYVFSLGDVGLVISKPKVGSNSVPSKTWSIMSASRPVLASFDENELKTIIEENQCGIFTKAGDIDTFVDSILKLHDNPNLPREMGDNGREFVLKNLTKEIGTQKYVRLLSEVVKNGK